jgi:hypothetical protein
MLIVSWLAGIMIRYNHLFIVDCDVHSIVKGIQRHVTLTRIQNGGDESLTYILLLNKLSVLKCLPRFNDNTTANHKR